MRHAATAEIYAFAARAQLPNPIGRGEGLQRSSRPVDVVTVGGKGRVRK